MKKTGLKMMVLVAVAAMGVAACGRGNKAVENNDSVKAAPEWSGVSVCSESDCVEVIGIQDREGEQAVELFRGSYDDALLDSLVAPGQTAFRSAFNVYIARGRVYYEDTVEHTVLFDAGIGPQAGGKLLERMKDAGVAPADIEAVCLTHLHFDHLGWLLDEEGKVTFPNADIYLSEAEMASGKDNERWQQVLAAYGTRVKTFAGHEKILGDFVYAEVIPGHTPGHTYYMVETFMFVGDLLHAQDLQLKHPDFCARYDGDPDKARQVRKAIYEEVEEHELTLCGAHCYEHFIRFE